MSFLIDSLRHRYLQAMYPVGDTLNPEYLEDEVKNGDEYEVEGNDLEVSDDE